MLMKVYGEGVGKERRFSSTLRIDPGDRSNSDVTVCICVCVCSCACDSRLSTQCLIHRFAALVIPKWQHPLSARSPRERMEKTKRREASRGRRDERQRESEREEEKKDEQREQEIMCVDM